MKAAKNFRTCYFAIITAISFIAVTLSAEEFISRAELLKTLKNTFELKRYFSPDGEFKEIELKDGSKALTVIFHENQFEPEISEVEINNPEVVKINNIGIEDKKAKDSDHMQFWVLHVSSKNGFPEKTKNILTPEDKPNKYHRELAFLGVKDGLAWFSYSPIYYWVFIQRELGFTGGDDPIAAAIRGTIIDDTGCMTRNSCYPIISDAGTKAIPYLENAIKENHSELYYLIWAFYSMEPGAVKWLMLQTVSTNHIIATASRQNLIFRPRKEAIQLYLKWLSDDAGKKDVTEILKDCRTLEVHDIKEPLLKVLSSPYSVYEYRIAFEMRRELVGKPVPKELIDAEKKICKLGFGRKEEIDTLKLSDLIDVIVKSNDYDAAAAIGISLATFFTKGNVDSIRESGITILSSLPNGKGLILARLICKTCNDEFLKEEMKTIVETLEEMQPNP